MCWRSRVFTATESTQTQVGLQSNVMADQKQSTELEPQSLADLTFLIGDSPKPHPPRFLDPRVVEAHFKPLLKGGPTDEERLQKHLERSKPFPGV